MGQMAFLLSNQQCLKSTEGMKLWDNVWRIVYWEQYHAITDTQ